MLVINGANPELLISFLGDSMKLRHLGTKSTTGTWELTGLTPMVPIIFTGEGPVADGNYGLMKCSSGSDYEKLKPEKAFGYISGYTRTYTQIIVPTSDKVVLSVTIRGTFNIHAFTGE